MAHSNRKKLKAARGGKTRHQANKQSNFDAMARIKELERWQENRTKPDEPLVKVAKSRSYSMKGYDRRRRTGALNRLYVQMDSNMKPEKVEIVTDVVDNPKLFTGKMLPLTEADKQRIEKEMGILVTRGAILKTY